MDNKTIEFLQKLKDSGNWNDEYDYSKVEYVNSATKVLVIDKKFNTEHLITPNGLIQINSKCSLQSAVNKTLFCIKQFQEIHGNKYDYSLVSYVNEKTKIIIICPEHGEFSKLPYIHRKESGCVYCYRENKPKVKTYLSYEEAKSIIKQLRLSSVKEYNKWFKENKPDNLSTNPDAYYKDNGWISWGDFLGNGKIASQFMSLNYLPFDEARTFVHTLNLTTEDEWRNYCKSNKYNINIPKYPESAYKNKGWVGYKDFLSTNNLIVHENSFMSFEIARNFTHSLKLKSRNEWDDYNKKNKIVKMPKRPSATYKNYGWISWGDWLGTNSVKTGDRKYLPFNEAITFVHTLNLTTEDEWRNYCKSGLKPNNIPSNPQVVYSEYNGQPDWLGYERYRFTKSYKITLINSLETSDLLTMDPFEIYTIIGQGKLPNDFGTLSNTDAGSDERITTLRELKEKYETETEDETTTDIKIEEVIFNNKIVQINDVDYEITSNNKKEEKLPNINVLDDLHSLDNNIYATMDKEAFESLIQYKLRKHWNNILNNVSTIEELKNDTGGQYFTTIKNLFFDEYESVIQYQPKPGYSFIHQPNLMQKLTVLRLLKNKSYGNWSGTGAGKTLSFIIASREIDSKLTIIIALNSTINQISKSIKEVYPNSKTYTDYKESFIFDRNEHNYLILNYEKFQQEYSEGLFQDLTNNNQIDFVVIDEVHNAKQRNEDGESIRRGVMNRLLGRIREQNENLYILVMSATPVVNNLYEARSLLQLITGLDYDDIKTKRTLGNALKIFQQLILNGIRYIPKYDIKMSELTGSNMTNLNIDGSHLLETILKLPKNNYIGIEKLLLDDKLKAITPYLRKGVILYSYFTTDFINEIEKYAKSQGFKVGSYTGEESLYNREENLSKFISGNLDILIGSKPIGTGVDGLQCVCDRMILLTLPWTDSEYTQLKGRIYRQNSTFGTVEIIIPQVRINLDNEDFWSWDVQRLNVIKNKKTLADAAVDGIVPSKVLPTPNTMFKKTQESLQLWKDRINNDNLIELNRNNIQIDLYPEIDNEEERRKRIDSELSEFNRRGKTTHSNTMHKEFTENPDRFFRYHKLRTERMEKWSEIPYEYIATKIKDEGDIVVDFGCGENKFKNCIPKNKVYSFDHVAFDDSVIACDIKDVSEYLDNESVDVALFSLSLWGTNHKDYIKEAYRVLKHKGMIYIAEPINSYETPEDDSKLIELINEVGFQIVGGLERRNKFIYITGIKIS
jgi:superfamily II DNA or RNA helicase